MDSIKDRFHNLFGYRFDDFMLLDTFDIPGGKHTYAPGRYDGNASKYLLYNDPFMGLNDYRCSESDDEHYKSLAKKMEQIKSDGDLAFLFEFYQRLAEVLAVKSYLGVRTRSAYLAKDKEALKTIALDYTHLMEKLAVFHTSYEKLWHTVNKPHGFDVQDMRIGGVIQRVKSCKARIEAYINGEILEIPELSEEILEARPDIRWSRLISANVVAHYL
jgi:hypothetical protein